MNRNLFACAAAGLTAAVVFGAAAVANAATIGVSTITGAWSNVQGGQWINNSGSGSTTVLSWGYPADDYQSGYKFAASSTPISVPSNTRFILGTFTHYNEPIKDGTGITSAQLTVSTRITIDGKSIGSKAFNFVFDHNETDNGKYGCCNDLISVSALNSSSTFDLNGVAYTLKISGFEVDGKLVSSFSTIEGKINTAKLVGEFAVAPVPAAAWLMGSGLLSLAGLRRLRRRSARQAG
jgi:hypothetical protein